MRTVIIRFRRLPFSLFVVFLMFSMRPAQVVGANKSDAEKAGALLFRDKGCAYCHGAGGVGTRKAPDLTGLPKDKQWTPDKITNQILNGGQKMPPFRDSLTDEEAAQLVAYLRAKNKPPAPSGTTAPANLPAQ